MLLVYTHPHLYMVEMAADRLRQAGMDVRLCNQFSLGAAGELAPQDTWPELWLTVEQHRSLAQTLLADLITPPEGPDWRCAHCGETNDPSFDLCWSCGTAQA